MPWTSRGPGLSALRKDVSGSAVDLVPVWSRQIDLTGIDDFLDATGVRGANDRLHFGRVALEPCNGHARLGHAIFFTNRIQDLVKLWEFGIVDKYAFEESELEWRPWLDRDFLESAIIENSTVAID